MMRRRSLMAAGLLLVGGLLLAEGQRGPGTFSYGHGDWIDEDSGLLVMRVLRDSPAARAGIVRGDTILKIAGQEVRTVEDVYSVLSDRKAGETIELEIRHGDETKNVELTLEERLFQPPVGIQLAAPDWQLRMPLLPGRGSMVWVQEVLEGSSAEKAGILAGDAIASGDPRKGREVFNSTCVACHQMYGEGGTVGPDLTGANRTDIDYLLSNILISFGIHHLFRI